MSATVKQRKKRNPNIAAEPESGGAIATGLWVRPHAPMEWVAASDVSGLDTRTYVDREYARNLGGSRLAYDVGRALDIDDARGPFICEPGPNVSNAWMEYDPSAEVGLSTKFRRIGELLGDEQATKEAIGQFASRYGLLGFRMVPINDPFNDPLKPDRVGESLRSWELEAFKFGVINDLCALVRGRRSDPKTIAAALARTHSAWTWFSKRDFGVEESLIGLDLDPDSVLRLDLDSVLRLDPDAGTRAAIESARKVARDLLNYQLDMHVATRVDVRKSPLVLAPRNLIGAIYLQFAFKLNGGDLHIRTCANPDCGKSLQGARRGKFFCNRGCRDRYIYLNGGRGLKNG